MQEEEQHKEQQRQNFNNMVEAARAEAAQNPPPPHDPMRFRALPPGEAALPLAGPLPPAGPIANHCVKCTVSKAVTDVCICEGCSSHNHAPCHQHHKHIHRVQDKLA